MWKQEHPFLIPTPSPIKRQGTCSLSCSDLEQSACRAGHVMYAPFFNLSLFPSFSSKLPSTNHVEHCCLFNPYSVMWGILPSFSYFNDKTFIYLSFPRNYMILKSDRQSIGHCLGGLFIRWDMVLCSSKRSTLPNFTLSPFENGLVYC